MESRKLDCEIVTPLFLAGSDVNEPELRPPSLKGVMRYWWRAVNSNLDLKALSEKEASLFGTSKGEVGRSKFNLRIQTDSLDTITYPPTTKQFEFTGFKPGQNVSIYLTSYDSVENFKNILQLSLLLGGLGRRSRRGFGSLQPSDMDLTLEEILNLINSVGSGKYSIKGPNIVLNHQMSGATNYPYLKEVAIGKEYPSWKELLNVIINAAHECRKEDGNESLGFAADAENDRLASPVCVSILKNSDEKFIPIISTLNTVFKKSSKTVNATIQEDFKNMILTG